MLNQCTKLFKIETTIIFLISIFTILRYQGLISPYLHPKFYSNHSRLNEDIYYNNQFETFVYDLVNFNYTNDYLYLLFYLTVCAIGYIFTYKILKKYSILSDKFIYLTLLLLSGLDGFIMYDVKSSLSPFTQSPSTMLSWSLFPVTIYFLLEKRIYILSLIIFFNILISIKFGLFPSFVALIYNLVYEKKIKERLFLFLPIIFSIFSYSIFKTDIVHENIYNDINVIKKIFENIGDLRDFLILEQRYLHLILLFSSFLIFLKTNEFTQKLSSFFKLLFYITILMIISHIIYFKFIFNFYPDIRLFMLSAVANLAFYQFIFAILLVHIVFKIKSSDIVKFMFLLSIIYWNGEEHLWISKKISISLFLISVLLYCYEKYKYKFIKSNNFIILILILTLYFPILLANYYRFSSTFSSNLFESGNKKVFTNIAGITHLENSLMNLKKCKNISILVFYRNSNFVNTKQHYLSLGKYPNKQKNIYYPSYSANIIAKKSYFYENNGRLFKKEVEFDDHYRRAEILKKINYDLNSDNINIPDIEKKINFPFLIITGDNLDKKSKNIYFINSNLINDTDFNCYKNL